MARSGAIMAWENRPVALPLMSKYFCSSKEDVAVEARPGAHLAAFDVVGQVVEQVQADVLALGLFPALDLVPGVVERAGLAVLRR
jgi:hypothetical protein